MCPGNVQGARNLDAGGMHGQGWCSSHDAGGAVGDDALRACVSHLAQLLTDKEWAPATLRFDGLGEFPVSDGGGRVIDGDPLEFVLVATGRADPATLGLDDSVNVYAD